MKDVRIFDEKWNGGKNTGRAASGARHLLFRRRRHEDLSEGLVWRRGRPANHDQKDIKDKESDGQVIEESGLGKIWPELVGGPEEEGDREQDSFEDFHGRGAVR